VKRKVGLFLLVVIVAVTLGATLVVALAMYRLVSKRQAQEIHAMEVSLSQRFGIFEALLHSEHALIDPHMEQVLPLIAGEVKTLAPSPGQLSQDQLNALSRKYGVYHIYFIDRSHKVFQTNLATDLNLQFPTNGFARFLDTVYGKAIVKDIGVDIALQTGTLRGYSYYGPAGEDYIIEASVEIRSSLGKGDFGWMRRYFFKDMFSDAVANNEYVRDVDLYLVNDAGAWSLLHTGTKLDPAIAARVVEAGRYTVTDPDGRLVTVYSTDTSESQEAKNDPVVPRLVIRKITYDVSLAREAVINVLTGSSIVLLVALPLVFWLASSLLQHQLLNPLLNLRTQARAIAGGDLDHAIADTERRDEIGHLATSFATMRDAVRSTILDLKETNASIERFVPRPFLAMIGKPSIMSVKLGDNRRLNMTVMFSDIRNFTGLSEEMTPDENFAFINSYLARMGPVIRAHHGFIDKYIGDAIMALFEHADDALRAGLAMLDTLRRFNADRQAAGLAPIAIGIGLNSGSLMLGTIGETDRMDGTVISDAVNLASRIETLTKTYGISLLISQNTYAELTTPKAHDIRPIDVVVVKGKTRPVAIYEVFEANEPSDRAAKSRTRDLLLAGVEALSRHDTATAHRMFEQCLELLPDDPAATNLLKRCA
jgi:class 3 adenylate cyclase